MGGVRRYSNTGGRRFQAHAAASVSYGLLLIRTLVTVAVAISLSHSLIKVSRVVDNATTWSVTRGTSSADVGSCVL